MAYTTHGEKTGFPPPPHDAGWLTAPLSPGLHPFLGSRARSSLAWANQAVLVLLLILLQLILSQTSVQSGIDDAKANLAASCNGVEDAASVAVSLPHFMAAQVNDGVANGAEAVVHGLGTMLDLSIQGIEAIAIFIVDTYRSLYLCLAEFVVRGSLSLLISATEEAEQAVTTVFQGIRTGIQDSIGAAEKVIDGAVSDINKIPGVNIKPPSLSVPNLDALSNVTLPTGLSDALTRLNASLPTLDQLRDELNSLIATPFEAIRSEINTTMRNATIDRNLFTVPARQTVAFCQDMDTSFINDVGSIILFALRALIIATSVAIALIIALNVLKERYLFQRLLGKVEEARERWLRNDLAIGSLLAFVNEVSHPFIAFCTPRLVRADSSRRRRDRTVWALSYLTWPPALLFFGLGLLGLFVVEIQLAALSSVRARAIHSANEGVGQFSNLIADRINAQTANASGAFANSSNAVILGFQHDVNDKLFGWANTTTTTLNSSLTTFYDGLTGAVNDTFGSTPLAGPAQELINCLIGNKVQGIQKALTFIHDNAHLSLPTVSPTLLMLSTNQTDELAAGAVNPKQASAQESGSSTAVSGFVDKLMDRYARALTKQRVTFLVFIMMYGLVILGALIGVLWARKHADTSDPISTDYPWPNTSGEREPSAGGGLGGQLKASPQPQILPSATTRFRRGKEPTPPSPLDFSDRPRSQPLSRPPSAPGAPPAPPVLLPPVARKFQASPAHT